MAITGGCADCAAIKIKNIQVRVGSLRWRFCSDVLGQINGNRRGAPPIAGGANIEIGGPGGSQLIEYVKSYDPRGWSCLHVAEGVLNW